MNDILAGIKRGKAAAAVASPGQAFKARREGAEATSPTAAASSPLRGLLTSAARAARALLSGGAGNSPARVLRVLLYGDSLIAGYLHFHGPVEPWHPRLQSLLSNAVGQSVEVEAIGVGGMTAASMASGVKFGKTVQTGNFDLVAVHAGANDLMKGGGRTDAAQRAVEHIATMHEVARRAGAATVALGVPEGENLGEGLRRLNEQLKELSGADLFFDTAHHMPHQGNARLWSEDGVHLSREGYAEWARRMSEPLARLLSEHAARSEGEGAGASGRRHGAKGRRGAEEDVEPISTL